MNNIYTLLVSLGLSLALTLGLEYAVALMFRIRGKDIFLFVLVNILTNPIVVYLNTVFCIIFPDISVFAWQIPLEICAIATEGFLYFKFSRNLASPWKFAVAANLFSYSMGLLLNTI